MVLHHAAVNAAKAQSIAAIRPPIYKTPPPKEVRTPQGYSLDAVVSVDGLEVAVEVDGPFHFIGREPNGRTILKRRQLLAAGWPLLSVPYWEWDPLTDAAARRKYLERGLADAMAAAPSTTGPTGGTFEDATTTTLSTDRGAAELEALPYRELQQHCKAARLPATGKKAVLVERLLSLQC